jgi:serine/threonine protein kinase/tetratricopeptide (TPR) repeat protein
MFGPLAGRQSWNPMNPQRYSEIREVFFRIREAAPSDRPALLEDVESRDQELGAEVKRLLDACSTVAGSSDQLDSPVNDDPFDAQVEHMIADAACHFLDSGSSASPSWQAGLGMRPGDSVGPYRLTRVIGEGGFGVAYEAERSRPFAQRVAIKIIKPGMDSKAILARFDQERQAIAMLDHPSVARVFDGGVTAPEQGTLPYFVMEFVEGDPITTYADRKRLSVRDRVSLLSEVCAAVHHAHTRGIIHRDLKPSNILAFGLAESHAVKVIDFGVAKALTGKLTDASIHTVDGAMVGTPGYMSPEQARSGGVDVDTRTDVYAIGVLLYELIAGVLPFDPETLFKEGLLGAQRIIAETNPPRPSSRFSQIPAEQRRAIARDRSVDDRTLQATLRNDLDWIVMKCLEKDRERRYSSAAELADDLRRYLDMQPVIAGPPSRRYRAQKFIRRNRLAVGATALVIAGLSAGLIGVSVGLARAQAATERAREEADLSGAISSFLVDDLLGAPSLRGPDVTVRELLDEARSNIGNRFSDMPLTEAGIRYAVGRANEVLGLIEPARKELATAFESMVSLLGYDDVRTLDATAAYASVLSRDGEHELSLRVINRVGASRPELAAVQAAVLKRLGRPDEAALLYKRAMGHAIARNGENSRSVISLRHDIALNEETRGNLDAAEQAFAQALADIGAHLPSTDPQLFATLAEYARFMSMRRGNKPAAESMYREAADRMADVLGEEHWRTALLRANLATFLFRDGRAEEALPFYEQCFDYYTTDLSDRARQDGPRVLPYYREALRAARGEAAAVEMLRSAVDASTLARGADDPATIKFSDLLNEFTSKAP